MKNPEIKKKFEIHSGNKNPEHKKIPNSGIKIPKLKKNPSPEDKNPETKKNSEKSR